MAQPQAARLFNDLYFDRLEASPAPHGATWPPFSRLPPELRLHIWLTCLRQRRWIGVSLIALNEGPTPEDRSQYYKNVNHLGKVVSGRPYLVRMRGHRDYSARALSPLLWVNAEARRAALSFYHIQLPCRVSGVDKTLYLNAAYDVVHVSMRTVERRARPAQVLADFLHDAVAFDHRDQGIAHLALLQDFFITSPPTLTLVPSDLHPTAAESFARILAHRLRTVLCIVTIRANPRGGSAETFHHPAGLRAVAQTVPLGPIVTRAAIALRWLETDPRVGVPVGLDYLALDADPGAIWGRWEAVERAFGVQRREEGGGGGGGGGCRFYVCPTADWVSAMPPTEGGPLEEEERELRALLGAYVRDQNEEWRQQRRWRGAGNGMGGGQFQSMDGVGQSSGGVDAAIFGRMQEVPSAAVGLWLFEPAAFNKCLDAERAIFNVSATKPGLLLFDV